MGAVARERGSLTLACARVLNGEGGQSASPAWVTVERGRVVATGTGTAPAGAVDLGDALLAPGFVDIQVNGSGDADFATAPVDGIVTAVDAMVASGTTTVVPTICTAPLDAYAAMLARLEAARAARPDAIAGVHLEGPFLGGAPGAHPPELVLRADVEWLDALCARFGDLVRVVTLAPEADPECAAIRMLVERGVVVALGHSTASYDEATLAAAAGARVVTHLFNGMGPMHHRSPGLAGAALTDARLVPTLIADFVHVHPAVVKMALDVRADTALVTDAVSTNPPVIARDGAAYLADGTLTGSTVTMAEAVRNVASLGLSPARAVRLATANPARVLGRSDVGRVAPGARADLVALDPQTLHVRAVWAAGTAV